MLVPPCSILLHDVVLKNHGEVFEEGIGIMKEGLIQKFYELCSVPFTLREAIERDLDRLIGMDVLEKVNHPQWTSPIVPAVKPDNSIRICGDSKVTVKFVC